MRERGRGREGGVVKEEQREGERWGKRDGGRREKGDC